MGGINDGFGYGGRDEGDRGRAAGRAGGIAGFNDTRGVFDRVGDFLSGRVNEARANPIADALMGKPTGRKTLGARVPSFSPDGRQYVTPWAYRG